MEFGFYDKIILYISKNTNYIINDYIIKITQLNIEENYPPKNYNFNANIIFDFDKNTIT